jgi:hypothetical protein
MTTKEAMKDESKEMLIAEFEYIASTANQANEDRARVSSFYLIAVGSLIAALFSTQLLDAEFDMQILNILLAGLFFILTLLGTLTIMQLARLRGAWFESMLAMNQIKEYIISKDKNIVEAFRWRTTTAPKLYKVNSISYQQTLEVSVLSTVTFGAGIYCLQSGAGYNYPVCNWTYICVGALLAFVGQLYIYKRLIASEEKRINQFNKYKIYSDNRSNEDGQNTKRSRT